MTSCTKEEVEIVSEVTFDDEDDYVSLPLSTANQVAKFPPGCTVIQFFDRKNKILAAFGTVHSVGIHLQTRETTYKIQPSIADSNFVQESELFFAPQTPVWVVLLGRSNYTSAVILSASRNKTYVVIAAETHEVINEIDNSVVFYRGEQFKPPHLSTIQGAVASMGTTLGSDLGQNPKEVTQVVYTTDRVQPPSSKKMKIDLMGTTLGEDFYLSWW